MFRFPLSASLRLTTALTAAGAAILAIPAFANPQNGQVVAGNATISTPDATTTQIDQSSQNVIINWGSFNIDPNETTRFVQPNADAWALNRVVGSQDPSVIAGSLQANGNIAIINPDGIVFSQGARVDVGGLVATTADIANEDFMFGNLTFNVPGSPSASIVNEGNISIADHGLAAFVAPGIRNSGVITARFGSVSLAAGNSFSLDLYGDGLISLAIGDEITSDVYDAATGERISDLVKNEGTITTDGGIVALSAATARTAVNSVINNTGVIEARSVGMRNGKIVLGGQTSTTKPKDALKQTVRVSGVVRASTPSTSMRPRVRPSTGGTIEITGQDIQIARAEIDASGANGGGKILIGGDYLGGQEINDLFPFGEEIREDYEIATTETITVDNATTINASATEDGDGGKVILWSDMATRTAADIFATGTSGRSGGFIETSSAVNLSISEGFISAGSEGSWLLDPRFLFIGTTDIPEDAVGRQTVSVSSIENALNSGTDVSLLATGNGAVLDVDAPIRPTSANGASLLLGSEGQLNVRTDIVSENEPLNIGLVAATDYVSSSGEVTISGTIDTNGGRFGFSGGRLQFNHFPQPGFPGGRVVTRGGDVLLRFGDSRVSELFVHGSAIGCQATSGCFGDNSYVIDAGNGDITLNRSDRAVGTTARDFPVMLGNFAIRNTGALTVDGIALSGGVNGVKGLGNGVSIPSFSNDGAPEIQFGSVNIENDAEVVLSVLDNPQLEPLLAAPITPGANLPGGNALNPGYALAPNLRSLGIELSDFFGSPSHGEIVGFAIEGPAPGNYTINSVAGDGSLGLIEYFGNASNITVTLIAFTSTGQETRRNLTLSVPASFVPSPVADTPPGVVSAIVVLPDATKEAAYSATTPVLFTDDNGVSGLKLMVSGLPVDYSWADNSDGTVTIAGTPSNSGAVSFTITATDAVGNSVNTGVSFIVNAPTVTPEPPTTPETGIENGTAGQSVDNPESIQDERFEGLIDRYLYGASDLADTTPYDLSKTIASGQELTPDEANALALEIITTYESGAPYLSEGLDVSLRVAFQNVTGVAVPSTPLVVQLFGIGVSANAIGNSVLLEQIVALPRKVIIAIEVAGQGSRRVTFDQVRADFDRQNRTALADALQTVGNVFGFGIGQIDTNAVIDQLILAEVVKWNSGR